MANLRLAPRLACALALTFAVPVVLPAAAAADDAGWHWTSRTVAPGVTVSTGVLSRNTVPYWTVTIDSPTTNRLTGKPANAETGSTSWAKDMTARLTAAGFPARQDTVNWPAYSDTPKGAEGVRVRTGHYPTQADANAVVTALKAAGFPTAVAEWTGYDLDQAPDAERVHVATIDPRVFHGQIAATHDGTVAQRKTTSAVAADTGALVAVNGGFFVTADADGYQGVPSGLAAYNGQVEALASGHRAALVLGPGGPRIENPGSTVTVRAGRDTHPIQGVNRKPGVVRDCGRPDAAPTTAPRQDVTCTSTDELVAFTPDFGAALPTGGGIQVTLDAHGRVTAVGARGGSVPARSTVIQGIGSSAGWLAAHARRGAHLQVDGLRLPAGESIASAAPVLLRHGRFAIDAAAEGVVDPKDLSFNFAWAQQRQPRTMAGIDKQGRLVLATVDGRQPGVSEGFTLTEEAQFLRTLGVQDGMNLDGGGSSAFAVDGKLVNHTSDLTGERAVGDVIVVRGR